MRDLKGVDMIVNLFVMTDQDVVIMVMFIAEVVAVLLVLADIIMTTMVDMDVKVNDRRMVLHTLLKGEYIIRQGKHIILHKDMLILTVEVCL